MKNDEFISELVTVLAIKCTPIEREALNGLTVCPSEPLRSFFLDACKAAVETSSHRGYRIAAGPALISPQIDTLLIGYTRRGDPSLRKYRVAFPMGLDGIHLHEVWKPDATGIWGYHEGGSIYSTQIVVEAAMRAMLRGSRPVACGYAARCAVIELGEIL